jgi:hypothetical protein
MIKTILIATLFASAATGALAQAGNRSGTAQEQKACAKDVSRHCRTVMNESDLVILSCLQQHRAKISKSCDAVLKSHGQ